MRMSFATPLLVAATALTPPAVAAAVSRAPRCRSRSLVQQVRIPHDTFRLKNGLTVIIHEDHKAPVAAVRVWYHVGSKVEPTGKTGFAHLFEHLMFGGSGELRGTISTTSKKVGVTDYNGTTYFDRTNYFETMAGRA